MKPQRKQPLISIVMGSHSDWPTLEATLEVCSQFSVPYDVHIISAHRTPEDMANYAKLAHKKGIKVIIAAAGGAAHLPGMIASHTPLPVIGVPVKSNTLNGIDSLLSIVQMPGGVPVATVAIGAGKNAGLLALEILAINDTTLMDKVISYKQELANKSRAKDKALNAKLENNI